MAGSVQIGKILAGSVGIFHLSTSGVCWYWRLPFPIGMKCRHLCFLFILIWAHPFLEQTLFIKILTIHQNLFLKSKEKKNTRTRRKEHAKLNVEHEKRNQIETKGNTSCLYGKNEHKISGMKKYGTWTKQIPKKINEQATEKNYKQTRVASSKVRTLTGFFPTQIIVYKKTKIKTQKKLDRSTEWRATAEAQQRNCPHIQRSIHSIWYTHTLYSSCNFCCYCILLPLAVMCIKYALNGFAFKCDENYSESEQE